MASSLGSLEERHQNASGLGEGGKEMGKRSKAVDRRGQSHAPEPPPSPQAASYQSASLARKSRRVGISERASTKKKSVWAVPAGDIGASYQEGNCGRLPSRRWYPQRTPARTTLCSTRLNHTACMALLHAKLGSLTPVLISVASYYPSGPSVWRHVKLPNLAETPFVDPVSISNKK